MKKCRTQTLTYIIMQRTFRGGLKLPGYKEQSLVDHCIYPARPPSDVFIFLLQHRGSPAVPTVRPGDKVRVGQKIADVSDGASAAIHSSVSGEVLGINFHPHPELGISEAVVIKNDGFDVLDPAIEPRKNVDALSERELLDIVREAGIVEMDGTGASVYEKLKKARQAKADALIINACESEPFLTSLHVLMISKSTEVLRGVLAVKRMLDISRVWVAIEDNKTDALEVLGSRIYSFNIKNLMLRKLPTRYPQQANEILIPALTGKHLKPGEDPLSLGVLVMNLATCYAISEAVYQGKPLYERVITVAGQAVAKPRNMQVRLGATAESIVREAGGFLREPSRLLMGGPMTSISQPTLSVAVSKQTSAVLALIDEVEKPQTPEPCIRCSACMEHCPADIIPSILSLAAEEDEFEIARDFGVASCIECGNCAYVCPSKRPMVRLLQYAKSGAASRGLPRAALTGAAGL